MQNTDYITKAQEVERSTSMAERELKGSEAVFLFSSSLSALNEDGKSEPIETGNFDNATIFAQNLKYWNQQTGFMSVNNLDNQYFREIVNMGVDAVPFIIEELKKGPSQLVYALDLMFPDVVKYEGSVSLKEACDTWISILQ